jgi:amino-acid N-acetyltransferase
MCAAHAEDLETPPGRLRNAMYIRPAISPGPSLDAAMKLLSAARLPTDDLTPAHCEDFFFAGPAAEPTGLVGLECFGDVALLRSLVVAPERRGSGDGTALLKHAEDQARTRGVRSLYLLTTTAEPFFARHGYQRAARESAPAAIRATREFAGICPASSAFMVRRIDL